MRQKIKFFKYLLLNFAWRMPKVLQQCRGLELLIGKFLVTLHRFSIGYSEKEGKDAILWKKQD